MPVPPLEPEEEPPLEPPEEEEPELPDEEPELEPPEEEPPGHVSPPGSQPVPQLTVWQW
jgi:hypothetical protein